MGISVAMARIRVSMLSCLASRCCTKTNAMPVLGGRARSIWVKASSPPAEAPIPTMATGLDGAAGATALRLVPGFLDLRVAFFIGRRGENACSLSLVHHTTKWLEILSK
jgi:hypothetical protein